MFPVSCCTHVCSVGTCARRCCRRRRGLRGADRRRVAERVLHRGPGVGDLLPDRVDGGRAAVGVVRAVVEHAQLSIVLPRLRQRVQRHVDHDDRARHGLVVPRKLHLTRQRILGVRISRF